MITDGFRIQKLTGLIPLHLFIRTKAINGSYRLMISDQREVSSLTDPTLTKWFKEEITLNDHMAIHLDQIKAGIKFSLNLMT